ncbi:MAG: hypothetical protein V1895_01315 [Parcubacteria group bacterium]
MWHFFWDIVGFVADNVSRNLKLLLAALILLTVFFFVGLNGMFYFVAGVFWLVSIFFVIANLVVRLQRARQRAKMVPLVPLTAADQADITEFQQAMEQQPASQAQQQFTQGQYTPPTRKAAPPPNLPAT